MSDRMREGVCPSHGSFYATACPGCWESRRVNPHGLLAGSITMTMLPTDMLRDLLGSVSAELRLRGQIDSANYVARAIAAITI